MTPSPVEHKPDERLPRSRILKNSDRIQHLLARGLRRHGRMISLYFAPSERPRAAFLVPKRYGKAVLRNLQKRRLRELYRRQRGAFPENQDVLLLLRAPKGKQVRVADWQELKEDLNAILSDQSRRLAADPGLSSGHQPTLSD